MLPFWSDCTGGVSCGAPRRVGTRDQTAAHTEMDTERQVGERKGPPACKTSPGVGPVTSQVTRVRVFRAQMISVELIPALTRFVVLFPLLVCVCLYVWVGCIHYVQMEEERKGGRWAPPKPAGEGPQGRALSLALACQGTEAGGHRGGGG